MVIGNDLIKEIYEKELFSLHIFFSFFKYILNSIKDAFLYFYKRPSDHCQLIDFTLW